MESPIKLTADRKGERLDIFIARKLADISRTRVQNLIENSFIKLCDTDEGRPTNSSYRLTQGERISIVIPDPSPSHIVAQNIPLQIVYEDTDILLIAKPAGMTVHPAPGHRDKTLVNAVLAHVPDLQGVGGVQRPGLVHRLDKDTSGLIVLAKNDSAFAHLTAQFKAHKVNKKYIALVSGHPSPACATIEAPIGRSRLNRKRMAVVKGGRQSTTNYRIITVFKDCSLVEAVPITGRTHQIRVHLASIGHPVIGDRTYGKPHSELNRQFLHATSLEFRLPSSNDIVVFTAPLPPELSQFVKSLQTG